MKKAAPGEANTGGGERSNRPLAANRSTIAPIIISHFVMERK